MKNDVSTTGTQEKCINKKINFNNELINQHKSMEKIEKNLEKKVTSSSSNKTTKANVSNSTSNKGSASSKLATAAKIGSGAGALSSGMAFAKSNLGALDKMNLSNTKAASQENIQTTTESTQGQNLSEQSFDNSASQAQSNTIQQSTSDTSNSFESTSSQNSTSNYQNETNDFNNQANSSEKQQFTEDDLASDSDTLLSDSDDSLAETSGINPFTKVAANVAGVATASNAMGQSSTKENSDTGVNTNQQDSDRSGTNGEFNQKENDNDQNDNTDTKETDEEDNSVADEKEEQSDQNDNADTKETNEEDNSVADEKEEQSEQNDNTDTKETDEEDNSVADEKEEQGDQNDNTDTKETDEEDNSVADEKEEQGDQNDNTDTKETDEGNGGLVGEEEQSDQNDNTDTKETNEEDNGVADEKEEQSEQNDNADTKETDEEDNSVADEKEEQSDQNDNADTKETNEEDNGVADEKEEQSEQNDNADAKETDEENSGLADEEEQSEQNDNADTKETNEEDNGVADEKEEQSEQNDNADTKETDEENSGLADEEEQDNQNDNIDTKETNEEDNSIADEKEEQSEQNDNTDTKETNEEDNSVADEKEEQSDQNDNTDTKETNEEDSSIADEEEQSDQNDNADTKETDEENSSIIDEEEEDDLYTQEHKEDDATETRIINKDDEDSDNSNLVDEEESYYQDTDKKDNQEEDVADNIVATNSQNTDEDYDEDYDEDNDAYSADTNDSELTSEEGNEQEEVIEENEALLDDTSAILSGNYLNQLNLILNSYNYNEKNSLIKVLTVPEYTIWYFKVFDEHIHQLLVALTKKDSYEKAKEYLPNYSFNKKLNVEYLPQKAYDYLVTEHYGIQQDLSTIISIAKEGPNFSDAINEIYNDLEAILKQIDEKNKWLDDNLFQSIPHIFIKHYQEVFYGSSDSYQSSFFDDNKQFEAKDSAVDPEVDGMISIKKLSKWIEIKSKETKKYNNTSDYDFDVDVFKEPIQPPDVEGLSVNEGMPPNYSQATFAISEIIDLLKQGIKLHQVLDLYIQMSKDIKKAERKVGDLMNKLGEIANVLIQMLEDDPLEIYLSYTKFSISDFADQSPVLLISALMGVYTMTSQKFNEDFNAFSEVAQLVGENASDTYNSESIFMYFYNTELQKILNLNPDIFNEQEEENLYSDLDSLVKNTNLNYEESIYQVADYLGKILKYFDKVKDKFDSGQETNYISTHRFLAGKTKDFYENIKDFLNEESQNLNNHSVVVAASPNEEVKEMNEVLIFLTYVMSLLSNSIDDDLMEERLDPDSDIIVEDEYIQKDEKIELSEFELINYYEQYEPKISKKLISLDRINFYLRQNGFLHIDSSTYAAEYVEPYIGAINLSSKVHVGAIMIKFDIKDAHSNIRYLRDTIQAQASLNAEEKEKLFNNIMQAIKDYIEAKKIITFIHLNDISYQYQIPINSVDDEANIENQNEDFEVENDNDNEDGQEDTELTQEEEQAQRLINSTITDHTYKYDFDIINKDTQPMDLTLFFMNLFNSVTALDSPYERFVPTTLNKYSVIHANLGTLDQLNSKLPSSNNIEIDTTLDEIINDKVKYHAFLPVIQERRRQSRMDFRRKNASPQRKF